MLFKTISIMVFAAILLVAASCSDECATCTEDPLAGTWILNSIGTEGDMQSTPDDTLIYSTNGTGEFRPELGWGWNDFTYSVSNDTIFQTVTAGQNEGTEYARKYEIKADSLYYIDDTGSVPVYTLWLKK